MAYVDSMEDCRCGGLSSVYVSFNCRSNEETQMCMRCGRNVEYVLSRDHNGQPQRVNIETGHPDPDGLFCIDTVQSMGTQGCISYHSPGERSHCITTIMPFAPRDDVLAMLDEMRGEGMIIDHASYINGDPAFFSYPDPLSIEILAGTDWLALPECPNCGERMEDEHKCAVWADDTNECSYDDAYVF
jgi:hypothetical protein